MNQHFRYILFASILFCFPISASATYSIIACDPETGDCGVAVATNNLAVGASVCYAQANVGAVVSQFETNPSYGPEGLRLLSENIGVENALAHLLTNDNTFEGLSIEYRQVALINTDGQSATHTGKEAGASRWAGARSGRYYSIQGNGLDGEHVVHAMEQAFQLAEGTLAERLMSALNAGEAAGGQRTGSMSAALLVRTTNGWPHDIDLRVDASERPVDELYQLLNLHYARQSIIRAERFANTEDSEKVWNAVAEALHRGASWDRIWRRAARLAIRLDQQERALEYLAVFMSLNPTWASEEITQDRYAELIKYPVFQEWIKSGN